jgi:uncharacterized protein with NRDE domain
MCVIFFAVNQHPKYKFIVAANRDEFYERPTAQADFWAENTNILAGKDLVHGGTWLGVTKNGRFAAVTNFRGPNQPKGKLSRGNLVKDFLFAEDSPQHYLQQIQADKDNYTGFNLLVGELSNDTNVAYYSNISDELIVLNSGIFGLSNHLLDTDWHKVRNGKAKFAKALNELSTDNLLEILSDKTQANDEDLPDTGVGIERERILSPIFIETPIYGTRCSSVLLFGNNNKVEFIEKKFVGDSTSESKECFVLIPKQERNIG